MLCTLRNISSFLEVFPSDLLPQSIAQTYTTVIVKADPHRGRMTLASRALQTRNLRVPIVLIHTASYRSYPHSRHS